MPDLVGLPGQVNHMGLMLGARIEDTELDSFRVLGKKRKINPLTVPSSSQWIGGPAPDRKLTVRHRDASIPPSARIWQLNDALAAQASPPPTLPQISLCSSPGARQRPLRTFSNVAVLSQCFPPASFPAPNRARPREILTSAQA